MGLDIYTGTLTRYYTGNWKTAAQKWAEENGFSFNIMHPNRDEDQYEVPDVDIIQNNMQEWSRWITNALIHSAEQAPWEENNSKDYYTDKPDWCAYGALLLYAACLKYGITPPLRIKKSWRYTDDKIIVRAKRDEEFKWSLLLSEWWLPFDDCFLFQCQTPGGNDIGMSTTGALLAELERINELGWNADKAAIIEWSKTEGYPADAEAVDGTYTILIEHDEYDVESLAKFAYSIFYQAVSFAQKNNVPLLMDY